MYLIGVTPIIGVMFGLEYIQDDDDEQNSWLVLDLFIVRFTFWLGD